MSIGNNGIPDAFLGIFQCRATASKNLLYKRFSSVLHRFETERGKGGENRTSRLPFYRRCHPSPPSATLVMVAFFVLNFLLFGMVSRGGSRIAGSQFFQLYATLLWMINDFPTYGDLSGWSMKGYQACAICMDDKSSFGIQGKISFMEHRRYLRENHVWRRSRLRDGKVEHKAPLVVMNGYKILEQLDQLEFPVMSKHSSIQDKKRKRALNWTKKSIFFDFPYWSRLLLHHKLDVMHIEKNICDNLVGTLLNIEGRTKDTTNVRLDLQDLQIRKGLHLVEVGIRLVKSHASYTLTSSERVEFCKFLKSIKFFDGFVSNISRMIRVSDLNRLQAYIIIILFKLERIFPPAFFSVMYVRNKVRLKRSIVEVYVMNESSTFCSRYLRGIKTRFTRDGRNDDTIVEDEVLELRESSNLFDDFFSLAMGPTFDQLFVLDFNDQAMNRFVEHQMLTTFKEFRTDSHRHFKKYIDPGEACANPPNALYELAERKGKLELFWETHIRAETFVSQATEDAYNQMLELQFQATPEGSQPLSEDEICDQVLGRRLGCSKGLGWRPKSKVYRTTSASSSSTSFSQSIEKEIELQAKFNEAFERIEVQDRNCQAKR
ncbi:uncharacterized protein E5676_scaffold66G00500 [Cucumis melo var. makuwa]|uniref:DUF4218 domain-containing protein n=1 Tax=Cucumis melo var. makuwa TaxID=1194695 RepID=A0A5D3CGX4_CUCMM|nr:uncharacterized protein E5676_scaffold66G00500 [Cucumis melo var. makuwa]